SYTVDTLASLRARHPGAELWFLMGADALADLEAWHQPAKLLELANFAVATRPGYVRPLRELLPAALAGPFPDPTFGGRPGLVHANGNQLRAVSFTPLEISAREIRRRAAAGESIRYLVPDDVREYIAKHHLYSQPHQEREAD